MGGVSSGTIVTVIANFVSDIPFPVWFAIGCVVVFLLHYYVKQAIARSKGAVPAPRDVRKAGKEKDWNKLNEHHTPKLRGSRKALATDARARLLALPVRRMALSHGEVAYVDCGPQPSGGDSGFGPGSGCETILSVHGLYGGYDQALDSVGSLSEYCRVIAPSRFGYPGSAVRGDGSPADQAAVFAEMLNRLGIERVFVLGASAGGTPAIRFALDHP
mgnify:CR=1 FL=1